MKVAASLRIQDGDPVLCSAAFHDGEHKETSVDVEIRKTVRGDYPSREHVEFKTMPLVLAASAVCRGIYGQTGEVTAEVP